MLGDFAEYAGALILPLLLIGATLAILVGEQPSGACCKTTIIEA